MYNVTLKTGLSSSADDHSISEPQKKRGTYAFELLKNTERVYRNLYYSVLGTRVSKVWPAGLCPLERGDE